MALNDAFVVLAMAVSDWRRLLVDFELDELCLPGPSVATVLNYCKHCTANSLVRCQMSRFSELLGYSIEWLCLD